MDHKLQTDVILLVFQKAFDTGSSTPVTSTEIIILRYSKSNIFLDKLPAHSEEATSNCRWLNFCSMDSSEIWCPTGNSVIGPLMFLIYINDIGDKVSSSLWPFADDCVLYRTITSLEDSKQLQYDLDSILEWSQIWQMNFNIRKCTVLQCYRTNSPYLSKLSTCWPNSRVC